MLPMQGVDTQVIFHKTSSLSEPAWMHRPSRSVNLGGCAEHGSRPEVHCTVLLIRAELWDGGRTLRRHGTPMVSKMIRSLSLEQLQKPMQEPLALVRDLASSWTSLLRQSLDIEPARAWSHGFIQSSPLHPQVGNRVQLHVAMLRHSLQQQMLKVTHLNVNTLVAVLFGQAFREGVHEGFAGGILCEQRQSSN